MGLILLAHSQPWHQFGYINAMPLCVLRLPPAAAKILGISLVSQWTVLASLLVESCHLQTRII